MYVELLDESDDGTDRLQLLAQQSEPTAPEALPEVEQQSEPEPDGSSLPTQVSPQKTTNAEVEKKSAGKNAEKSPEKKNDNESEKEDLALATVATVSVALKAPRTLVGPVTRLATGSKPLIVRAGCSLESEQVGQILPGKLVQCVEAQQTSDGLRARVVLTPDLNESTSTDAWVADYSVSSSHLGTERVVSPMGSARLVENARAVAGPFRDPWHVCNSLVDAASAPSLTTEQFQKTGAFRPIPGSAAWAAHAEVAYFARNQAIDETPTGWVTAVQANGTVLLTPPHSRVEAGERQQHMRLWAQRKTADNMQKNAGLHGSKLSSEAKAEAQVGLSSASTHFIASLFQSIHVLLVPIRS